MDKKGGLVGCAVATPTQYFGVFLLLETAPQVKKGFFERKKQKKNKTHKKFFYHRYDSKKKRTNIKVHSNTNCIS